MRGTTQDIFDLAIKHVGEAYVLGARAPMCNSRWRGPWDCAEFASWCLYQATGVLFGVEPRNDPLKADAYTGFWADQARKSKATVPVAQAAQVVGAFVLRKSEGARIGHIVISDGRGGTIEAHSSKYGVKRASLDNRRWDFGILVPGVKIIRAPKLPPLQLLHHTLRVQKPLLEGAIVKRVQRALTVRGYSPGRADGVYGPQTAHAVRKFQADNGLVPDGEVGPVTFKALGLDKAKGIKAPWSKQSAPL